MKTMDANEITKQVIDFQKETFSGWYDAMSIMQDQAASTVDTMLNQSRWIPDEGRQAIMSWVSTCRNERDRFKIYVEESLSSIEKYINRGMETPAARSKRPAAEGKKPGPAKSLGPAVEEKKDAPAKSLKTALEEKKAVSVQETKPSAQ